MPAHWCIYKLMFYIHFIKLYLFYISEYKEMLIKILICFIPDSETTYGCQGDLVLNYGLRFLHFVTLRPFELQSAALHLTSFNLN